MKSNNTAQAGHLGAKPALLAIIISHFHAKHNLKTEGTGLLTTIGIFLASGEDFKAGYTVTAAGVTEVIKSMDLRKSRIVAENSKLHVVPSKAVETATWVVEARGEAEKAEEEKEE
jgi:hypothetical protein